MPMQRDWLAAVGNSDYAKATASSEIMALPTVSPSNPPTLSPDNPSTVSPVMSNSDIIAEGMIQHNDFKF